MKGEEGGLRAQGSDRSIQGSRQPDVRPFKRSINRTDRAATRQQGSKPARSVSEVTRDHTHPKNAMKNKTIKPIINQLINPTRFVSFLGALVLPCRRRRPHLFSGRTGTSRRGRRHDDLNQEERSSLRLSRFSHTHIWSSVLQHGTHERSIRSELHRLCFGVGCELEIDLEERPLARRRFAGTFLLACHRWSLAKAAGRGAFDDETPPPSLVRSVSEVGHQVRRRSVT